ncbi:MAG: hypothetical protein PHF25_08185 [Candidatus Margulisbacteria bacterium]|nr:hypothetical protein [Candidatus Margulisiibacteriota bacterium]
MKIRLMILLLFAGCLFANPMLSGSKIKEERKCVINASILSPVVAQLSIIQKDLRKEIVVRSRSSERSQTGVIFLVMGMVFLYGVIHAIGPGHGKIIAISYFMGEKANLLKGIFFGFVFSLIHSTSALILFLSMKAFAIVAPFVGASKYEILMQKFSFYLVAAIGAYMLIKALNDIRSNSVEQDTVNGVILPFTLGLVPCPGTLLFLAFFSSIGLFWFGILSVFVIALGMAVSLSIISIIVIIFRDKVVNLIGSKTRGVFSSLLSISSAIFLIIIGLLLGYSL